MLNRRNSLKQAQSSLYGSYRDTFHYSAESIPSLSEELEIKLPLLLGGHIYESLSRLEDQINREYFLLRSLLQKHQIKFIELFYEDIVNKDPDALLSIRELIGDSQFVFPERYNLLKTPVDYDKCIRFK